MAYQSDSELFIALLKQRFHGRTADTFYKFIKILDKFGPVSGAMDRSSLFKEVTDLFTDRHYDLVERFKGFVYYLDGNRASSVESNIVVEETKYPRPSSVESNFIQEEDNYLCSVPLDRESINTVVSSCLDFVDRVHRVLNDKDKYKSFTRAITGFLEHGDVERVRLEVFGLFKEHPELEIEFSEFIAEASAKRTVQDMVVSKKRKREEAEERTARCKGRKLSESETKGFRDEDELYKQNLGYELMLLAKEGAERLIKENRGNKHLKEEILIAGYFRGLNVKFMKKELNMERFLKKCKLLSRKTMRREKAILQSEKFVHFLDKEIKILTSPWSEEMIGLLEESRERDLQIPVFDWH